MRTFSTKTVYFSSNQLNPHGCDVMKAFWAPRYCRKKSIGCPCYNNITTSHIWMQHVNKNNQRLLDCSRNSVGFASLRKKFLIITRVWEYVRNALSSIYNFTNECLHNRLHCMYTGEFAQLDDRFSWHWTLGAPTRKFKQNPSYGILCFLRLFQTLLKGYFCRPTQVDLFGFLKIEIAGIELWGAESDSPNFPAAVTLAFRTC